MVSRFQKKLKLMLKKVSKRANKIDLIQGAESLDELLSISGFVVSISGGGTKLIKVKTEDDLYDTNIETSGIQPNTSVEVKNKSTSFIATVCLSQQPATCSNLFMHNLVLTTGTETVYLLKLVKLLASYADYTRIQGTCHEQGTSRAVIEKAGFTIDEPYINNRTDNSLVDFKFIL